MTGKTSLDISPKRNSPKTYFRRKSCGRNLDGKLPVNPSWPRVTRVAQSCDGFFGRVVSLAGSTHCIAEPLRKHNHSVAITARDGFFSLQNRRRVVAPSTERFAAEAAFVFGHRGCRPSDRCGIIICKLLLLVESKIAQSSSNVIGRSSDCDVRRRNTDALALG